MRSATLVATALLLLSAASAAHAATPAQFDLVCMGTSKDLSTEATQPWSGRFSLDVGLGAWAKAPEQYPEPIVRVDPARIYLSDPRNADYGAHREIFVDRTDGRYTEFDNDASTTTEITGDCAVAPFTTFKKNQF